MPPIKAKRESSPERPIFPWQSLKAETLRAIFKDLDIASKVKITRREEYITMLEGISVVGLPAALQSQPSATEVASESSKPSKSIARTKPSTITTTTTGLGRTTTDSAKPTSSILQKRKVDTNQVEEEAEETAVRTGRKGKRSKVEQLDDVKEERTRSNVTRDRANSDATPARPIAVRNRRGRISRTQLQEQVGTITSRNHDQGQEQDGAEDEQAPPHSEPEGSLHATSSSRPARIRKKSSKVVQAELDAITRNVPASRRPKSRGRIAGPATAVPPGQRRGRGRPRKGADVTHMNRGRPLQGNVKPESGGKMLFEGVVIPASKAKRNIISNVKGGQSSISARTANTDDVDARTVEFAIRVSTGGDISVFRAEEHDADRDAEGDSDPDAPAGTGAGAGTNIGHSLDSPMGSGSNYPPGPLASNGHSYAIRYGYACNHGRNASVDDYGNRPPPPPGRSPSFSNGLPPPQNGANVLGMNVGFGFGHSGPIYGPNWSPSSHPPPHPPVPPQHHPQSPLPGPEGRMPSPWMLPSMSHVAHSSALSPHPSPPPGPGLGLISPLDHQYHGHSPLPPQAYIMSPPLPPASPGVDLGAVGHPVPPLAAAFPVSQGPMLPPPQHALPPPLQVPPGYHVSPYAGYFNPDAYPPPPHLQQPLHPHHGHTPHDYGQHNNPSREYTHPSQDHTLRSPVLLQGLTHPQPQADGGHHQQLLEQNGNGADSKNDESQGSETGAKGSNTPPQPIPQANQAPATQDQCDYGHGPSPAPPRTTSIIPPSGQRNLVSDARSDQSLGQEPTEMDYINVNGGPTTRSETEGNQAGVGNGAATRWRPWGNGRNGGE